MYNIYIYSLKLTYILASEGLSGCSSKKCFRVLLASSPKAMYKIKNAVVKPRKFVTEINLNYYSEMCP